MKQFISIFILFAILFSSCKSVQTPSITGEWEVTTFIFNNDTLKLPSSPATILLTDTGTIYGSGSCNRYFGTYTFKGKNKIDIVPTGRTQMFCPEILFEDTYIKALEDIDNYSIQDSVLVLSNKNKDIILKLSHFQDKIIGVSNDSHGCNAAAGYTWSEIRNKCIRVFEDGIRVNPVNDPRATTSAFIIFSIDSLKAEIFLPDQEEHPILSKRILPNGKYAWNMEDDDTYNIRFTENQWIIEKRGKILYSTKR